MHPGLGEHTGSRLTTGVKDSLLTLNLLTEMNDHQILKGSWGKFSCGIVISLIETSWRRILQFHPWLPFVEVVLHSAEVQARGMMAHGL